MRYFILFIILLPLKSIGQCPQWIGSSIENAKVLRVLIQKHLHVNWKELADTINDKQYQTIEYRDDQGLISFKIGWYVKKSLQNSRWVNLPPVVNDVSIKGPADKIDKLLDDLNNQIGSCPAHSRFKQSTKFLQYIMSWDSAVDKTGVTIKYVSIKPFSQNK